MRTSLNEIKKIEQHIFGKLTAEDPFYDQLKQDQSLTVQISLQKKLMRLLFLYDLKKKKDRISAIGAGLLSNPAKENFQNSVKQYFKW